MLRDGHLFGRKASSFTLQWHLTHACEFSCRHCYDRTSLACLPLAEAENILDSFLAFCRARRIRGQICLTGGNPFLYSHFLSLYRAIAATDCPISILGNPVTEQQLAEIVELRRPTYFQVSLEGQRDYNDVIRGSGHFQRVMDFLPLLRKWKVPSQVMLTLHKENMEQLLHEHGRQVNGGADIAQRIAKRIQLGRGPVREYHQHVHVRGRAQPPLGRAAEQDHGAQVGPKGLLGQVDEFLQVLGDVFGQAG